MKTAIVTSVKNGMATVRYGKSGEASNPMPILESQANASLLPGDRVVVAPLNGKKDGIILGRYWNQNNLPGGQKQ